MCVHCGQSLFPKYPVSAGAGTWAYELPKPLFWSSFQNKPPDTQTWTQMHTTSPLAAGLPHAIHPVAGSGSSFSTQVSQSTPRPSKLGFPVPVIATSSGGLAHGHRLWGDPNSLSHGILVMGDSSGPQGKSCLCGAGSGLMSPPRGYWGFLSCHGATRLIVCCRWEDSSYGMGK